MNSAETQLKGRRHENQNNKINFLKK